MRLDLLTWPEVEQYLLRRRDLVIPIGSTEQHGPSGLIGTDALCAEAIARAAGERAAVLVGPTLALGNAQHHLGFAGTISLRPSTLMRVVIDVVESARSHGFERIVFVNGHGGNVAPVHTAFAEVHGSVTLDARGRVHLELVNWWEGPRVRALVDELYGARDGQHATCGEISLVQALHPERIAPPPPPGTAPAFSGLADAEDYRRRYPDGRIGSDPSLSSPADGARLLEAAVVDLVELLRRI